jgi:hypothetical protein
VIKAFDKKGLHAGKFSVKYKVSGSSAAMIQTGGRTLFCVRVMEKTSTGFCCGSSAVIPLEVTYDCCRRRPDFLFCCLLESLMTVVKSVSDGLRDLSRPQASQPAPGPLFRLGCRALRPLSCPTPPKLHPAMGTRPRPRQAAAAAAGGDGAREARTGPRQTRTRCNTPATARLRRGRPLTTLQPTKRQPATSGEVEWGGRVTTARRTTTRTAPGCSPPPTYARWRCTEAVHNAHF